MAQLLAEGLSKDPGARPSVAHFARELHAMATGAHTLGGLTAPRDASRRRVVLISAAAVAMVVAVGYARWRSERSGAAVSTAMPAATEPRGTPATSAPASSFSAALADGLLTVLNAGDQGVADLRVTVYDDTGAAHEATVSALAPAEEVTLVLDAFTPPLSATSRLRRVAIQPAGGPAQDAAIR
jgi:hypothetical protein